MKVDSKNHSHGGALSDVLPGVKVDSKSHTHRASDGCVAECATLTYNPILGVCVATPCIGSCEPGTANVAFTPTPPLAVDAKLAHSHSYDSQDPNNVLCRDDLACGAGACYGRTTKTVGTDHV